MDKKRFVCTKLNLIALPHLNKSPCLHISLLADFISIFPKTNQYLLLLVYVPCSDEKQQMQIVLSEPISDQTYEINTL